MYCKLCFESDNFIFFIEKLFRKFKYNKEQEIKFKNYVYK